MIDLLVFLLVPNETQILTLFASVGQRHNYFLNDQQAAATYTNSMISSNLPSRLLHNRAVSGGILAFLLFATPVFAASGALTAAQTGKKLVADTKCEACHASKVGGDGSKMYSRQDRRVTNKSKLLSQVARCNNELNLGLFPDDEAAIAAYLNAEHYKFND